MNESTEQHHIDMNNKDTNDVISQMYEDYASEVDESSYTSYQVNAQKSGLMRFFSTLLLVSLGFLCVLFIVSIVLKGFLSL